MSTRRPFKDVTFAAPFGLFERQGEQEPPANETLIGRETQRASFLEALLTSGDRGAFLITGQRGAGKTTFTKHCLGEYEDEVYERFLRSTVDRSFFWDRAMLFALVWCSVNLFRFRSRLSVLLDDRYRRFGP